MSLLHSTLKLSQAEKLQLLMKCVLSYIYSMYVLWKRAVFLTYSVRVKQIQLSISKSLQPPSS